jgi:hypothetical protein
MITKKFRRKKLAVFALNTSIFDKNLIITLVFTKMANLSQKIG